MKWKIRRHPPGSRKGGRFASGQRADTVATAHLSLTADPLIDLHTDLNSDQQDVPWSNEPVAKSSELERFVSADRHVAIANSQAEVADTAAELWYAETSGFHGALRAMRGDADAGWMCSLEATLAKNLQSSAMDAPLDEPCVVYRGMKTRGTYASHTRELAQTLDVGDTVVSSGFWSTSSDPLTASGFAFSSNSFAQQIIFRISTPIGKFLPASSAPLDCNFHQEYEVVLPHGARFEVVSKETVSNDSKGHKAPDNPFQATLISLRYLGMDESQQSLPMFDGLENPTDYHLHQYRNVCEDIDKHLSRYTETGILPLGGRTTAPVVV